MGPVAGPYQTFIMSNNTATAKPKSAGTQYVALLLGGCASGMACFCTHPLDTLKVNMQMNEKALRIAGTGERPPGFLSTAVGVVKTQGPRGLYRGLSAALMRQATYSTVRFGAYDLIKAKLEESGKKTFTLWEKCASAMLAGAAGGVAGNPMDVANVRMQVRARVCHVGLCDL